MSSDNAQSAVTYTSISSDLDGPSYGIPLMNFGEFLEMDPYEEVSQQGQVHPLSPAYVPNPIELDEHVPVHVLEPKHPEYHASSNDDIQVEDDDEDPEEDVEEYPNVEHEPEDDNEDPEEDVEEYPNVEHEPEDDNEDPEEDPNEEHEPEDENTREPSEGSNETEPFEALIDAFAAGSSLFPLPTSPAYDQASLSHMAAMIRKKYDIPEEDMPPRRRFAFTAPLPGCDIAESYDAAARTPRSQAADRTEDVGYVRALQVSEHMMMTSIPKFAGRIVNPSDTSLAQLNCIILPDRISSRLLDHVRVYGRMGVNWVREDAGCFGGNDDEQ
nr:hypothetical protein [Tanacetum cinerariifolium]